MKDQGFEAIWPPGRATGGERACVRGVEGKILVSNLRNIYESGQFALSVEIFPPKTEAGDADLAKTLRSLGVYQPAFVSCTYGAGGSTQGRTLHWCRMIQEELGLTATAHFTCVGASQSGLRDWLDKAWESGVRNIMALRGDPPKGETAFVPAEDGLRYANELVALIRSHRPEMGIGVAGYPEKHVEATCPDLDLANLVRKVQAGADAVFTQMFFDNEHFFRFREKAVKAGIKAPIVPGVMPITSFERIKRISEMCGTEFPADLSLRLEAAKDNPEDEFEIGIAHAIEQCRELLESGVPGMHFYVLNRAQACQRIFDALGLGSAVAGPA